MAKAQRPSSWETIKAYIRHGQHEIGNALYGPGTVAAPPEYGMVGTKLPSEIAKDMRPAEEQEKTAAESPDRHTDRDRASESRQPEREGPELERD